jgi:hypothetical protein
MPPYVAAAIETLFDNDGRHPTRYERAAYARPRVTPMSDVPRILRDAGYG